MCYYNALNASKADKLRLLDIEKEVGEYQSMLNRPVQSGFEYGDWLILKGNDKSFDITVAHWEFIPSWNKNMLAVVEARKKFTTLNAQGEKLFDSKMYKEAAMNRRCLILSSGFYEWRHVGKIKYPYYITLPNKEYFYMAGIWQPWTDKETGETIDTFAIVTTEANSLMAQIHNVKKRMPVILIDDIGYEWIQSSLPESRIKELATHQLEAEKMQAYTIAKDFRTALDPMKGFEYERLEGLSLGIAKPEQGGAQLGLF
jgi:putative SOS response-associated peptidase YedK